MKRFGIAAAGLVLLHLGCTSLKINTKVRDGYARKLDRVCVVITSAWTKDIPFFEATKTGLEDGFKSLGVQNSVMIARVEPNQEVSFLPMGEKWSQQKPSTIKELPLDAAGLGKKAGFPPLFILKIQPTSRGTSINGATPFDGLGSLPLPAFERKETLYLLCTLTEADGGLIVWKAEIEMGWPGGYPMFEGPWFSIGPTKSKPVGVDPHKFAARIIERLKKDGLLRAGAKG